MKNNESSNQNKTKNKHLIHKTIILALILTLALTIQIQDATAQTTVQTCNDAGGIWCSNLPSGQQCVPRATNVYEGSSSIICQVTQNQNVNTKQTNMHQLHNYNFKSLTINQGTTLRFYTSTPATVNTWNGGAGGKDGGAPGLGNPGWKGPDEEGGGGAGGDGGTPSSSGGAGAGGGAGGYLIHIGGAGGKGGDNKGSGGQNTARGGSGGNPNIFAGARVRIYSEEIIINGILSVSGFEGSRGSNGEKNSRWPAADLHSGGGGGAGGSGAGTIYLVVEYIKGNGDINAIGGDGGDGGDGSSGSSSYVGGGGAGGGGGFGGEVFFVTRNSIEFNLNNIDVSGGAGGIKGISKEAVNYGKDGRSGDNGIISSNCFNYPEECNMVSKFESSDGIAVKIQKCNDGIDNVGNSLVDMNDPSCRSVEEWDSIIWDDYRFESWYNPSARDGKDLVCGDDIPSGNSFNDLGYITPDNYFACFDNSRFLSSHESFETEPVSLHGRNYTWRDARTFPGFIMRAHNSLFVSNMEAWHYCDATGNSLFGNQQKITEYAVVPNALSFETPMCSETISNILKIENFIDCAIIGDCESNVQGGRLDGYCPLDNGAPRRFNISMPDDFIASCFNCKLDGQFIGDILNPENQEHYENFCESRLFSHYEVCSYYVSNKDSPINNNFKDSVFCKTYPQACLGVSFSEENTCREIHQSFRFSFPENNPDYKFCNTEQYCHNGFLTDSNDEGNNYCCVGENSYCVDVADLTCSDMNGELFNQNLGEECGGISVTDSLGNDCCFGRVSPSVYEMVLGLVKGESLICYNHQNKSFLTECCGILGCLNEENNPLNEDSKDLHGTVYLMDGAPYHMLSSFDSADSRIGMNVLVRTIQGASYFSFRNDLSGRDLTYPSFRNNFSIEGFNYLEFDLLTNRKSAIENINLISNGETWSFNFADHFTASEFRWQRVRLELNPALMPDGFNKKQVSDIQLEFKQNQDFQFAINRIFLSAENSDTNSDTRYCTGNWGTWISNLDGPTNRGFFNGANPQNNIRISQYGPYKDACDASMSFSWTGSACCGDNSFGENKEYWIDKSGICWAGVPVLNDNTVANALSNEYKDQEILEKSLLFHGGQPWICNNSKTNYNQNFRFNNNDALSDTIGDKINNNNVVNPFTIKGNWMCKENEGWVKLDDINRMTLMAAYLLEEATQQSSGNTFTLHCGEMEDVMNLNAESDLLGSFCMLRTGINTDFIKASNNQPNGHIFIAFESKDLNEPLLENLHQVLTSSFDSLAESQIDCSNTPSNPDSAEFFSLCIFNTPNFEGSIYYNKPLKLVLISSEPSRSSFAQNVWDALKNFFSNIFGGNNLPESMNIADLDGNYKELYIAKQGYKSIVGISEIEGPNQKIRIDYDNLSTNLSYLQNAINPTTQNGLVTWSPQGYKQIIFSIMDRTNPLSFNDLSSTFRLMTGAPTRNNFGYHQNCTDLTDKAGETLDLILSGEIRTIYENNYTLYCDENKIMKCMDGQIYYQNNDVLNPQDYYFTCQTIPQYNLYVNQEFAQNLIINNYENTIPTKGSQTYQEGEEITIETIDNLPSGLGMSWIQNGNVINTNTIRMNADTTLTAKFYCITNDGCKTKYECDINEVDSTNNECKLIITPSIPPSQPQVTECDGANPCTEGNICISGKCETCLTAQEYNYLISDPYGTEGEVQQTANGNTESMEIIDSCIVCNEGTGFSCPLPSYCAWPENGGDGRCIVTQNIYPTPSGGGGGGGSGVIDTDGAIEHQIPLYQEE